MAREATRKATWTGGVVAAPSLIQKSGLGASPKPAMWMVGSMLVAMTLVIVFPQLVLWLPGLLGY